MDKDNYLHILKTTNLRPKKVKVEEFDPVILKEVPTDNDDNNDNKTISELFIQSSEIESMSAGVGRDTQILRLGMIAELDASNLYEKLAELATDEKVSKLMLDISREEKVHAGEFETLLEEIDPEYEDAEEEGEKEVEDLLGIKDED